MKLMGGSNKREDQGMLWKWYLSIYRVDQKLPLRCIDGLLVQGARKREGLVRT